ncbi:MAG: TIR domain-containing protein [Muribaculaceae bacterium]|nr:TIR domain-containing protein [Muribaculaceae bacterium]
MNIPRHKVFISYYHKEDQIYKDKLINMKEYQLDWQLQSIFEDCSVRQNDINDAGLNSEQIRCIIRDEYIKDATVLILLCGKNTRHRKHVDWEIHAAMYDSEKNRQMGIIVINLPTISQPVRASSNDEKPLLADNVRWYNCTDRSEFEKNYPYMPSRIIDNFVKDVPITVVNWDRIENNPQRLKQLIDNAFKRRFDFTYDHSALLKKVNSPC